MPAFASNEGDTETAEMQNRSFAAGWGDLLSAVTWSRLCVSRSGRRSEGGRGDGRPREALRTPDSSRK